MRLSWSPDGARALYVESDPETSRFSSRLHILGVLQQEKLHGVARSVGTLILSHTFMFVVA